MHGKRDSTIHDGWNVPDETIGDERKHAFRIRAELIEQITKKKPRDF